MTAHFSVEDNLKHSNFDSDEELTPFLVSDVIYNNL
jgi:hypothetical protein